jgi:hypothetical protein
MMKTYERNKPMETMDDNHRNVKTDMKG